MKDSKKEKKASNQEVFLELEEKEDVGEPEDVEEGGLHPAELAEELRQPPEIEVPEREKDVEVQSKDLPPPAEKEEQSKPSMITISKSEEILQAKQDKRQCPFNAKLSCKDCRLYQPFLGMDTTEVCSIILISRQMPL